jgi:hypothetical protein
MLDVLALSGEALCCASWLRTELQKGTDGTCVGSGCRRGTVKMQL